MRFITLIPFAIVMLLDIYLYAKACNEEDVILLDRAINLTIIVLINIIFIACSVDRELSIFILLFIIEFTFSIGASLWIIKTDRFEIKHEKYLCYCFLEEIVKVHPEDIKKFKNEMTREEQISFLQSLSYIAVDEEETTEVMVLLIEIDEDIEEWEPILKKK